MGYLVSNGKTGRVSYSGTQYMNPAHGTRRLCVRTAEGEDGIVRYGLTTDSSASLYCGLQVRVSGTPARIGRYEQMSSSLSRTSVGSTVSTSGRTSTRSTSTSRSTSMTSSSQSAASTLYLGSSSSTRTELMDGIKATVEFSVSSVLSSVLGIYRYTRSWTSSTISCSLSTTYASYTEHMSWGEEGEGSNNFNI